ncbi:MAG: tRNA epoxyqueuosine(34) reductase QueG [Bryobacteraceae bacterium]
MEIAPQRETPTRRRFIELARACGFELAGVAPALPLSKFVFYRQWVEAGLAGPMDYLADHRLAARADPRQLLPTAKSVLCVGKLYKTKEPEPAPGSGRVSCYAWGSGDYHDVLRAALQRLLDALQAAWGAFDARLCVDTAPLLERAYAQAAGLGWIAKNTCLINQPLGSWLFLGEILVSVALPPDSSPPGRCGVCRRCIDACPTQALVPHPGPSGPRWQLDARLCISTLTIEQRGPTAEPLRAPTGDLLFGCDICQDVCPWNSRAPVTAEPAFQPLHARPDPVAIASLTDTEFRARFRRTPLWRARRSGLLRNAATVMGNSGDPRCRPVLERLAASSDPGVAEHARWALRRLGQSAAPPVPGPAGIEFQPENPKPNAAAECRPEMPL